MRARRFHELHLALCAQVLGIAIAAGASCARTEPVVAAPPRPVVHQVTEYAAVATSADPMATPDGAPPPPDAATLPDSALPPPDGAPPPIPPRVAPDAQPLLPK